MKYNCNIFTVKDAEILDTLFSTLTEEQLTALEHLELDQQNAGHCFGVRHTLKGIVYVAGICVVGFCIFEGVKGVRNIIQNRKTKKKIEKNLDTLIKTTAEDFKEV